MNAALRPLLIALLQGAEWLLFGIAGLSFLAGGLLMNLYGQVNRLLAEIIGLPLAGCCLVLGFLARTARERLQDPDDGPAGLGLS